MRGLILPLSLFLLTACGDPIGSECELRSGALGFGFDDDCASVCLLRYTISCPDETTVKKAVCAGAEGCDPGSCGEGAVCYSFEDPFEKYFYCIPRDICGAALSDTEASAWEQTSRQRSDAIRDKMRERMERRTGQPTSPDVD